MSIRKQKTKKNQQKYNYSDFGIDFFFEHFQIHLIVECCIKNFNNSELTSNVFYVFIDR